jgi:hypothetical protein
MKGKAQKKLQLKQINKTEPAAGQLCLLKDRYAELPVKD